MTSRLSDDYPLLPGEKPPHIRRRVGAAFKLDVQSFPRGAEVWTTFVNNTLTSRTYIVSGVTELFLSRLRAVFQESDLNLVDGELALQMKIYEAARKLCEEDHLSKAVRKSRLKQCKREEKKVKRLQETAFQLRLEHGRSSPLPAFNIAQHGEMRLARPEDSSAIKSVYIITCAISLLIS